LITAPPRISIIHTASSPLHPGAPDSLMTFVRSTDPETPGALVTFTITAHELITLFGEEFYSSSPDASAVPPIVAQIEPAVTHEEGVVSRGSASYKWTVHRPNIIPTEFELSNDTVDAEVTYAPAFNSFKDSLTMPESLEARRIAHFPKGDLNGPPISDDRTIFYNFLNPGLYEVYCDVTIGNSTKTMATFVQIEKPEVPNALPPVLQAMPRYTRESIELLVKDTSAPIRRPSRPDPVEDQVEHDPRPDVPPTKKGV